MTSLSVLIACLGPIVLGPVGNPYVHRSRAESARDATRYHETAPHDPWMSRPAIAPAGSVTHCGSWVRDGYASIQVNVDPHGCNILGDAANEPSIAVDPTDPRKMVIGWRQFDSVESDFRQAGYAYSHDGGHTWVFPGVLDPGVFHSDPVLDAGPDGDIYYYGLALFSPLPFFRSRDGGITWDATETASGDKPWIVVDKTQGEGRGNVYVQYASYRFGRSVDLGTSFEFWLAYSDLPDMPPYPTLEVGPDGTVFWAGGDHSSPPTVIAVDAQAADRVPTFGPSITVDLGGLTEETLGPNPGGLAGQVWIATDHSDRETHGNVYVLASVSPSVYEQQHVKFSRSIDGGTSWSESVRVNDDPEGNGAFHWFGMISVAPNGRIDAAWIDTRNYPEAQYDNLGELYYSYSTDAGETWSKNVPVSPMFDSWVGWPERQAKLGDYYHMRSDNLGVNVAYAATFNGEQDVYFLRIGPWDCNANQIPDEDDIADRTSLDANGNTVPDECEYRGDADGDGLTTLRDYAAFQNCFTTERADRRFPGARPRWCIPRRASDLATDIGPRTRDRCNPACGLSDVDSDGTVNLPDLEGLTRLLTGP